MRSDLFFIFALFLLQCTLFSLCAPSSSHSRLDGWMVDGLMGVKFDLLNQLTCAHHVSIVCRSCLSRKTFPSDGTEKGSLARAQRCLGIWNGSPACESTIRGNGSGGSSMSDDGHGAGGGAMSGTSSEAAFGNRRDSESDDDDGAGGGAMSGTSSPPGSQPPGRGRSGRWGDQSIPGAKIFTLQDSNALQKVEHHHGTSILLHTNAVFEVKVIAMCISLAYPFYLASLSLSIQCQALSLPISLDSSIV